MGAGPATAPYPLLPKPKERYTTAHEYYARGLARGCQRDVERKPAAVGCLVTVCRRWPCAGPFSARLGMDGLGAHIEGCWNCLHHHRRPGFHNRPVAKT